MDIRKFFGSPKSNAVKKPTSNKDNETIKKQEEKAKSKLSNFKRGESEKLPEKVSKPQSTRKNAGSISKKTADVDEEIVIAESSDEDVIPCSLDSKGRSSAKKTGNSLPKKAVKSFTGSCDKKSSKDIDLCISKNSRDKTQNEKNQKVPDKFDKSKVNKPKNGDAPAKAKSTKDKNGKESVSKKTRRIQISEDESDEVSVIKDSYSEDDEEVLSTKRKSTGKRKRGKRSNAVLDSDSDEEDPVPKKSSRGKKTKAVSVVHDSDEEKVETAMEKFVKKSTSGKKEEPKKEETKKSKVNVSDFFGTGSVLTSRVERPSTVEKRKREDPPNKADAVKEMEDEMHDDDDFLQVLEELDGPSVKKVKLSKLTEEDVSEKATDTSGSKGGSLASKLANRMKASPIESVKEEKDINKNNVASSPSKKTSTPSKSLSPQNNPKSLSPQNRQKSTTKVTHRKTYTMEVESKPKSVQVKKVEEEITPKKTMTPPKAVVSSGKKPVDNEDDGFGTKKANSFRAFKMRGGPLAIGSKEIPEGAENCLEGLTFVITGVLDSIERDDAKSLVEKYGGKVTGNVSKKTSYVVIGREPGESKLVKAKDLKIDQIDEDGLLDLVRTLPGKTSKYELQAKEQLKKEESAKLEKAKTSSLKKLETFQADKSKGKSESAKPLFTQLKNSEDKVARPVTGKDSDTSKAATAVGKGGESLLWVDKHKPTALKQIIGQQGDKSNANKLLHWIKHWHQNIIVKGIKASGNFFGGKAGGDGTGFRAALLSGPPGIGKTTTATLVCKEAGFTFVELNASDTRSKRSLKEVVAESLNNQTLMDYVVEDKKSSHGGDQQHHCLIMDEVDGMAGNEDRGGLQELVQLIKGTKIPIVCICNDRNSMKMRTLANYCFDLRFQRPRVEQIKGAMMTLAFREGVKIPASAVQEIIMASNHDIRQVIHNLSMWSASEKTLTFEQVKEDAQKAQKDTKMGPFDVCRKVFVSDDETRKMSIHDKSDLFFHDYSFAPLFVHENYPHVIPSLAGGNKCKHMACLARTMDSLCDGDLVEKRIRSEGNWNLLPSQAMYSSVIPGEIMRGSFPQMTNFPAWLGKNSSTSKTDRILQELGGHMALKICCDKRGLNQDYLPAMRISLTAPLASLGTDGVPGVIQMMDDYDIIKDDFDNILEVSKWPNSVDYMARVESKTKAALTRMYNKSGHMTPYATGSGGKKKRGRATVDEGDLLREEGEEDYVAAESEEEEDDKPVVVAKPKSKKGAKQTDTTKTSKGKAGAGGGSKGKKK